MGPKTAQAVADHCPKLKILNLNYTAVPPVSVAGVLENAPRDSQGGGNTELGIFFTKPLGGMSTDHPM